MRGRDVVVAEYVAVSRLSCFSLGPLIGWVAVLKACFR